MNELLKALLESQVLSEDTKTALETAIATHLTEAVEQAKTAAAEETRANLQAQWKTERDTLIESIDRTVGELVATEMAEFRSDVERFRDLEAEYASRMVEARAELAECVRADMQTLTESLDKFLEGQLKAEFEELRADLEAQRQNDFGRRMFEAFKAEFVAAWSPQNDLNAKLAESEAKLATISNALIEAQAKLDAAERDSKMTELLAPLSGRSRDVMEAILQSVATSKLSEAYDAFIGRVITESVQPAPTPEEKESSVLAEGAASPKSATVTVNGDVPSLVTESHESTVRTVKPEIAMQLKRIAGLN